MAAEEAASDTLWFMPEPAVMALCWLGVKDIRQGDYLPFYAHFESP